MKKATHLISFIIIGLLSGCSSSSTSEIIPVESNCIPAALQADLIAFYPFKQGSLNDFSGNNYNLSASGSPQPGTDRDGNANCAYQFLPSTSDYLTFVNPVFLDNVTMEPFSISLWYKPLETQNGHEILIGRDTTPYAHCPNTFGQWSLALYDLRRAVIGINQVSLWESAALTHPPAWKHLVVTCEGANVKLYTDGVLSTNSLGTECTAPLPNLNIGDLFIGKRYNGLLDDIAIFKKALSQTEVSALYDLPVCCQ